MLHDKKHILPSHKESSIKYVTWNERWVICELAEIAGLYQITDESAETTESWRLSDPPYCLLPGIPSSLPARSRGLRASPFTCEPRVRQRLSAERFHLPSDENLLPYLIFCPFTNNPSFNPSDVLYGSLKDRDLQLVVYVAVTIFACDSVLEVSFIFHESYLENR